MTPAKLSEILGLEVLHPGQDREIESCYIGDLLSWVMGRALPGSAWITIMSNLNVAAVALMTDVSCVILAEGVEPDEDLKKKFPTLDAAVLRGSAGAYELAHRFHTAAGL